jgi:acetyltransferase-like isoleucine patch superfamily enzyme
MNQQSEHPNIAGVHSGKRARFDDPINLAIRALNKLYSFWLRYTYPFARCGSRLSIQFPCNTEKGLARYISIGSRVIIRKDAWLNIVDDGSDDVKLTIGDNCTIGARSTLSVKNKVEIGPNVITGTCVLIQDHLHAHDDIHLPIRDQGVTPGGRVRIEEGCWIGNGAAIVCNQDELVIGRNCVIGTNALVTRSVPSYSVMVGNPARIARQYDHTKQAWVVGCVRTEELQTVG